jgi:hypothetical protein
MRFSFALPAETSVLAGETALAEIVRGAALP